MTVNNKSEAVEPGAMHKRRTTLADGRYEIFYTFGSESNSPHPVEDSQTQRQRVEEKEKGV